METHIDRDVMHGAEKHAPPPPKTSGDVAEASGELIKAHSIMAEVIEEHVRSNDSGQRKMEQDVAHSAPLPSVLLSVEQQLSLRRIISTELPPLSRSGSISNQHKPPLPPGAQEKALRARRLSSSGSRSAAATPRAIKQQQKFSSMDDPRQLATPEKLQAMTVIELKFMCRTNNWFGFSNLNKQGIISFIMEKAHSDGDARFAGPRGPAAGSPRNLPVSSPAALHRFWDAICPSRPPGPPG
jgi:hypothetical protein